MDSLIIVLIAVTTGLTEAFKQVDHIPKWIIPFISIGIGITLALLQSLTILDGIIIGLSASGLYSGIKTTGGEIKRML